MTEAVRASRILCAPIGRYADRLAQLQGYKSFFAAAVLGLLATLSLPPLYLWQILYVVFPSLMWLLVGAARRRTAFALGWWFGFGLFGGSLYWIGNALLISAGGYGWLLPFASFGLPAVFALYSALATLAAWHGHSHLQRGLLFAGAWVFAEWLRGHLFTGFPWNLVGYSWAQSEELIQVAAVFGIYGVSLTLALSVVLPSALADRTSRRVVIALVVSAALPLMMWIGGGIRLNMAPETGTATVDGIGLRIVQPSISQREKWPPNLRKRNMARFLDMSQRDRPSWITHIVWPETAATFFVEEDVALRRAMAAVIPRGGLLLTGAPRRQSDPAKLWNSLIAVDGAGEVVASYDKTHLVPFGEYIPFRDILPMDKIVHGQIDYSPGEGIKTLRLLGLPPVSALICYEVIFPGRVMNRADPPAWLLNITNDAWYGETVGPHQHLAIALVRAVEEGRPLIRATNTGISAVIDAYGRTIHSLGLNANGVIDSRLPAAIPGTTLFARRGELGVFFLLFGVLFSAFLVRKI
jgi:apolipoprotein N-acyltransferase